MLTVKYRIFQIKNIEDVSYAFAGWRYAKDHFNLSDYEEVYSGNTEVDETDENEPYMALEELFRKFNVGVRPEDYRGHSLSTSDIVELDGVLYYVDSFGWRELKEMSFNG